jgi:hypothetical protein
MGTWRYLFQERQSLAHYARAHCGQRGNISTRPPQTDDEACCDRIPAEGNDRDGAGGILGRKRGWRTIHDQHLDLKAHQLRKQALDSARIELRKPPLDDYVPSFNVPALSKTFSERRGVRSVDGRRIPSEKANPMYRTRIGGERESQTEDKSQHKKCHTEALHSSISDSVHMVPLSMEQGHSGTRDNRHRRNGRNAVYPGRILSDEWGLRQVNQMLNLHSRVRLGWDTLRELRARHDRRILTVLRWARLEMI